MKYCHKCGKQLPGKAIFCPYCKTKQQPLNNTEISTPTTQNQSRLVQRWWLWLMIGAIIAFLISGIGFMFYNHSVNQHSSQSSLVHTKDINLHNFYKVKLRVTGSTDDAWNVTGTTDAPDGSKVVAINPNDNYQLITDNTVKSPTVNHGKFNGKISASTFENKSNSVGDSIDLYVAATNQNVLTENDNVIDSKALPTMLNEKFKTKLTLTDEQVSYYTTLYN